MIGGWEHKRGVGVRRGGTFSHVKQGVEGWRGVEGVWTVANPYEYI